MTRLLQMLGLKSSTKKHCQKCEEQPKVPGYRFCRSCMNTWRRRRRPSSRRSRIR